MVAHRGSPEQPGSRDAGQVPLDERHSGALHGDIGAGAHRNADVGFRERRCIIDPIPRHGHAPALGAQSPDVTINRPWHELYGFCRDPGPHPGGNACQAGSAGQRDLGRKALILGATRLPCARSRLWMSVAAMAASDAATTTWLSPRTTSPAAYKPSTEVL